MSENTDWYPVNGMWYVPNEFPDLKTNKLQDGAVQVRLTDKELGVMLIRRHRIEGGKSVFLPAVLTLDEFYSGYRKANPHIDVDWDRIPPAVDTIVSQVDYKGIQHIKAFGDGRCVFDVPHKLMAFWASNFDMGIGRYRLHRDGAQEIVE